MGVDLTKQNEKVNANADVEANCKDKVNGAIELVINDANHWLTHTRHKTNPVQEIVDGRGDHLVEFQMVGSNIRELNNDYMKDHREDEHPVKVSLSNDVAYCREFSE